MPSEWHVPGWQTQKVQCIALTEILFCFAVISPAEVTEVPEACAADCAAAASPAGAAAPPGSSNAAMNVYGVATAVGSFTTGASHAASDAKASAETVPAAAPLASATAVPAAAQMASVKAMLAAAPPAASALDTVPDFTSDAAAPAADDVAAAVEAGVIPAPQPGPGPPAAVSALALKVGQPMCIVDCGNGQRLAVHITALPPGVPTGFLPTIMAQAAAGNRPVTFQMALSALDTASGPQVTSSKTPQLNTSAAMQHSEIQAGSAVEEASCIPEESAAAAGGDVGVYRLSGISVHASSCICRYSCCLYWQPCCSSFVRTPYWQFAWHIHVSS